MDSDRIAQRFPLVARPRPACPSLDTRIREVAEIARAATAQAGGSLALAASAHNTAALIASDCGLPDLARALCWQQFDVYLQARPLGVQTARYALEPVVNLTRLLIRDGNGKAAHHLLNTLYHAVHSRTDAVIDGRRLSFRDLTTSREEHHALCQWLWTVSLADGTRALTSTGHWDQARAHAEQHSGIGHRLLDGRQVAVLARCLTGDPHSALTLLDQSTLTEPWEQAVGACLTTLCLTVGARPTDATTTAMVGPYLRLDPAPELGLFRTRLGLTVIDLAGGVEHPAAAEAADRLVHEAVMAEDGYLAREILAHAGCTARLTGHDQRALSTTLHNSGLGHGTIPRHLMASLLAAVTMSESATAQHLPTTIPSGRRSPAVNAADSCW